MGAFVAQVHDLNDGMVQHEQQAGELENAMLDIGQDFSRVDSMVAARVAVLGTKLDPLGGCRANRVTKFDKSDVGGDAYEHLRRYKGKRCHDELQLGKPRAMPRGDDTYGRSDWSHRSGYDEFGLLPEFTQDSGTDEDVQDEGTRSQWNSVTPNEVASVTVANVACTGVKEEPGCRDHCGDSGPRVIDIYDEIGETHGCDRQDGGTTARQSQRDDNTRREIEHDDAPTRATNTRQVCSRDGGSAQGGPVTQDHERNELSKWFDCMAKGTAVHVENRMHKDDGTDGGDNEDDLQQLCPMTG